MSPRKPSTSSARPLPPRPRYLGLEAAGALLPPPRLLEAALRRAIAERAGGPVPVRVIRVEAGRAIAEIPHLALDPARAAWNGPLELPGGTRLPIATRRTWGTLLKGKAWLRRGPSAPRNA